MACRQILLDRADVDHSTPGGLAVTWSSGLNKGENRYVDLTDAYGVVARERTRF